MPTYILLKPGEDPIEDYPRKGKAPRSIALTWSGPVLLAVLLGAGLLCRNATSAAPPPALPTVAVIPTGTATATPTETATPSPTATLTETPPPTETVAPTDTVTPTPTITLSPTPTELPYIVGEVSGARELNVRFGPGTAYPIVLQLQEGARVTLVGRNNGADWAQLELTPGVLVWARMTYLDTGGESIARLPVLPDPPK